MLMAAETRQNSYELVQNSETGKWELLITDLSRVR